MIKGRRVLHLKRDWHMNELRKRNHIKEGSGKSSPSFLR